MFQLAKLSSDDMNAVINMKFLGSSEGKKASGSTFSLKFDIATVDIPKSHLLDPSSCIIVVSTSLPFSF